MSKITTSRRIDLAQLPFGAVMRWDGTTAEIEADVAEADLQAAVDAAPDADDPPGPDDRIAALEAEVRGMKERAAAEASKANPTAKDVAEAVTGPTR